MAETYLTSVQPGLLDEVMVTLPAATTMVIVVYALW